MKSGSNRWALLVLFVIVACGMGETAQTGFLDRDVSLGEKSYRYQVYAPLGAEERQPCPVILFLHGAGERGDDGLLATQVGLGAAIRLHRDRFPFLVVFPQAAAGCFWDDEYAQMALKALEQTIVEFGGDRRRVYLVGLSLGGYGTWCLAARSPGLFAAAVPICGWVDPRRVGIAPEDKERILRSGPFRDLQEPHEHLAAQLRSLPVWLFHGSADTVVPVEESRQMFRALENVGSEVRYTEYSGVGHNAWDRVFSEPILVPWLLAHQRRED